MSLPWFRLYTEFEDDPKVRSLPDSMQIRLVWLFCERRKEVTWSDRQRAFQWRCSDEELAATKKEFISAGFIDEKWNVLNWNKRQYVSDSSTERTREYRQRQKASRKHRSDDVKRSREQQESVPVAAADTETETEKDTESETETEGDANTYSYSKKNAKTAVNDDVGVDTARDSSARLLGGENRSESAEDGEVVRDFCVDDSLAGNSSVAQGGNQTDAVEDRIGIVMPLSNPGQGPRLGRTRNVTPREEPSSEVAAGSEEEGSSRGAESAYTALIEEILESYPKRAVGTVVSELVKKAAQRHAQKNRAGIDEGLNFILNRTRAYAEEVDSWPPSKKPLCYAAEKFFRDEIFNQQPEFWRVGNAKPSREEERNAKRNDVMDQTLRELGYASGNRGGDAASGGSAARRIDKQSDTRVRPGAGRLIEGKHRKGF